MGKRREISWGSESVHHPRWGWIKGSWQQPPRPGSTTEPARSLGPPGSSPPLVPPGGPDPTEGTLRMPCMLYVQVLNQEALQRCALKLARILVSHILLHASALHKNMNPHYLHKTSRHLSPGPLPIIIPVSTLFLCLRNQYLFLLPRVSHLTLPSAGRSCFLCIIVISVSHYTMTIA